jgi:hypothetical protein
MGRIDPGRLGSPRNDMPSHASPRQDLARYDSPQHAPMPRQDMARNDAPRNDTFGLRKITKEVDRRGHFHSDSGVGLREPEVVDYGFSNFDVGPGHRFGEDRPGGSDLGGPRQTDLDLGGPRAHDLVEQLLAPAPGHDPDVGEDELPDDEHLGPLASIGPGHGSGSDAMSDSDFGDPRQSVSGDWLRYAALLGAHHSGDTLPVQGLTEPGHTAERDFGAAKSPPGSLDP